MRFVNHYLSYFRQQLICHLLSARHSCRLCYLNFWAESCPSPSLGLGTYQLLLPQALLFESSCRELTLPTLWCSQRIPLWCMPFLLPWFFFFSFFVFGRVGVGHLRGYADLPPRWLWECFMPLICSPVGLHFPSRFGAGVWQHRSPLFSQCNVYGEALYRLGVQNLAYSWWFFSFSSAKCGSRFSGSFWSTELTLSGSSFWLPFLILRIDLDPFGNRGS
jgi:hypothetical protein